MITAIVADEPDLYTSCKVTLVNRAKLVSFLEARNIAQTILENLFGKNEERHGKVEITQLKSKKKGLPLLRYR